MQNVQYPVLIVFSLGLVKNTGLRAVITVLPYCLFTVIVAFVHSGQMIRYDTIAEINVDSKAEYTA